MDLRGRNIMVVDLETERSAQDCLLCGFPAAEHPAPQRRCKGFEAIGWNRKADLGLSIGCYFDYRDGGVHWFDRWTLARFMHHCLERQSLLVSFNGRQFDFSLMRALIRQEAERGGGDDRRARLVEFCDHFKALCATSYDILAEIWRVSPARKFERGLNSLDAISRANGYGAKAMDGAMAPRLWAQKSYAEVLNYCAGDVDITRRLFERIVDIGIIHLGDGTLIDLPRPVLPPQEEG